MNVAQLKRIAGFYGRVLASFTQIGCNARRMGWSQPKMDFGGQRLRSGTMRPAMPTPDNILDLPALITVTIPPEWEDMNGHVNVQHYLALYDQAGWPMLERLGIDPNYFLNERQGFFDLEHHVWYLAEMHIGDQVSAHVRVLARSEKRLHGLVFLVNVTRCQLSSVVEFVATGADLESRRTAALPDAVAARLDELIAAHDGLGWQAPRCGVMSA